MGRSALASVRVVLALGFGVAVLFGTVAIWRSARAIRSATEEVQSEREFEFVVRPLPPAVDNGFEPVSSPQVFQQAAVFQDHLYICGPAGLAEFDSAGSFLRQYAAGIESPGSPLVALAPAVLADSHEAELVLATAKDGILAFNGRSFRQILPGAADARAITAILPVASGHLLFGTKKRGVLVYDGKKMTELHPTLDRVYVTALAGNESDLWVGTLTCGVLHFHAGATENFGEAEGLPDPQVESLAISGDDAYVGTADGVGVFSAGRFSHVLAPGILATALLANASELYVGSEDQGVILIPLQGRHSNPNLGPESQFAEVHQLFALSDAVFAVARNGLYRMSRHGFGWQRTLNAASGVLTDRNVSALGADASGRLWVGYFDRGLDLLNPDKNRAIHVEDEHIFCVNRIFLDSKTGAIDVATANGLVRFNEGGAEEQVLTRADGLIADHVTDIVAYGNGLALSTPAGLTFLDASGARSMYAFQGLVNNHVYALGASGDELIAGTLGGLSVLNKGDVTANYTTTTSNLKHNWITAVVPVDSGWMVGTYGAGVLGLDRSGSFHSFEIATGTFEVNPNSMLVTANHVFAGTLEQGLYVYDRHTGRWSVIRDGLPSPNVTALAVADGFIYVGTDNGLVRIPEQKLHS